MKKIPTNSKHVLAGLRKKKVALVHHWLLANRGGEQIIANFLEMFDSVDVYTLFCDRHIIKNISPKLARCRIITSIFDYRLLRKFYKQIFFLYPLAIRSLRLQKKYDLIISSESGPAKGIRNPDKIPHICYVNTPMRYCHGFTHEYLRVLPLWLRPLVSYCFERLRRWDLRTVDGVDLYVANSVNVQKRICLYYKRDSVVCYPPVADAWFTSLDSKKNKNQQQLFSNGSDFYISVGALVPYKRIDLLLNYFSKYRQRNLLIIGGGSEAKNVLSLSKKLNNICYLGGKLNRLQIRQYMCRAQAFLFPGEEDFGLTILEAMSQGLPVIAFAKGGANETVVYKPNKPTQSTGILFAKQTQSSLHQAICYFEKNRYKYKKTYLQSWARQFRSQNFKTQMAQIISTA